MTDALTGKPAVDAEVTVVVVDESILALMPYPLQVSCGCKHCDSKVADFCYQPINGIARPADHAPGICSLVARYIPCISARPISMMNLAVLCLQQCAIVADISQTGTAYMGAVAVFPLLVMTRPATLLELHSFCIALTSGCAQQ